MTRMTNAATFAALHRPGSALVLPNAWDVASALLVQRAGATAVATTRDWVNTPPGDLRPPGFAAAVSDAAGAAGKGRGKTKVKAIVHDEKALAELGGGHATVVKDPVFAGSDGGLAIAQDASSSDWEKLSL